VEQHPKKNFEEIQGVFYKEYLPYILIISNIWKVS